MKIVDPFGIKYPFTYRGLCQSKIVADMTSEDVPFHLQWRHAVNPLVPPGRTDESVPDK